MVGIARMVLARVVRFVRLDLHADLAVTAAPEWAGAVMLAVP